MTTYRKTEAAVAALTPEQFRVTQKNGTERPGTGALLRNKEAGIYVDVVSGDARRTPEGIVATLRGSCVAVMRGELTL